MAFLFPEAGVVGPSAATSASTMTAHANDLGLPIPIALETVYGGEVAHPCMLGVNAHH